MTSIEMYTSIQPIRTLRENKRRLESVSTMSSKHIAVNQFKATKMKRRRVSLESSVHFNPQVNLRYIYTDNDQESPWIQPLELREMKESARRLAKARYISSVRNPPQDAAAATIHPARYEMNGDSLRGMEHFTDFQTGKLRQVAKAAALKSVGEEQCRQLLVKALSCSTSNDALVLNQLNANEFKIDTAQLSICYGNTTKAALAYAKRLAEEDAKEAAEILAQDL